MKRTFGKLITMLLCLTMILSLMPVTALAAPSLGDITAIPGIDSDNLGDIVEDIGKLPSVGATPVPTDPSGACGVSMHWHLSLTTGVLTISGNGAMFDWSGSKHAPWYAYRGNIKTVVVEMGVPSIGAYAFDGLTNLTAIELPASIERIGNYAFESCVKLADITLPDSITEIGIGAFENCTALTAVTLPAAIHKAADNLFKGCTALTEVIFPEGETELGASAFEGCSSLETVVWHELTKIGTKAFRGCTNMTLINFPDTLTEIGKDAFSGSGLKLVRLPKGLTTIDFLGGTDKLTHVFVPATVKEIADGQFANCKDLKQVDYEGSKLDWKNIRIEANNDMLQNAEFTYNRTDNFLYIEVTTDPVVTPAPTAAPTPVAPTPTPTVTPTPTAAPTPTVAPTVTPDPFCDHDNKFTTVAPTCTEDGYNEVVCTLCGEKWSTTRTDSTEWELASLFYNPIYFWDYPEYIPSRINRLFFDESDDYITYKDIPAAEYEAVMAEYFVVTDELLDELRYHTEFKREPDCMTYDAATDTYRIRKTGGWGGGYNGPTLQGYTVSGSTYEVYFAECKYVYLQNVLPEGTNANDYWKEQGNPESLDYAGYTFTLDPEGYPFCLAEVLNNGRKGIAEKNGDTYRIVDIVDYTEADLPDSFVTIDTKALGHNYVDGKCTRCGLTDSTVKPTPTVEPTAAPTPTIVPDVTVERISGKCGEKVRYELDLKENWLTVWGEGEMYNYSEANPAPWHEFAGRLVGVQVERGVTTIGDYAFADCTNVHPDAVNITNSVTEIGEGAFRNTPTLTKLRISPGVVKIGPSAFSESGLKEVTLHESEANWQKIDIAKEGNDALLSAQRNYVEIWVVDLVSSYASMPPWESMPSNKIGTANGHTYKFSGSGMLTSSDAELMKNSVEHLTIGGNLIIGKDYLGGCSTLKTLTLEPEVTLIGDRAFADCENLTEITLPETLISICNGAFANCPNLKTIHFNGTEEDWYKNVNIGRDNYAVYDAEITFGDKARPTEEHSYYEGYCINCGKADPTPEEPPAPTPVVTPAPTAAPTPTVEPTVTPKPLIQPPYDCPKDVCGPNAKWSFDEATGTLTITGEGDMYSYIAGYPAWNQFSDKITTVVIKEGITSIGENVFDNCTNVETIAIPATVTYIGSGAFTDCKTLCDVFYAGSKADWENVTIVDKLDYSLYGNSNILKAYIHYNSNGIVDLPTFTPNSNQPGGECGPNAVWNFNTNSGLLTIKGRGPVKSADWSKYNSVIREIVIEEGITAFDRVGFGNCSSLKKMKLADSIFFINYTFAPHTTLESFNLPASLRYYFGGDIDAKNFYITDLTQYLEVFSYQSDQQVALSHISADNTYLDGKLLTDLVIPEGITTIPFSAFRGWKSLETVTISNSVETIGNSAFQECRNLNTVTLSDSLKTIESCAFYRCSKLTSITIPASMEMAMGHAFGECGLKTIIFEGNAPLMASDTFGSVKADAYYPAGDSTWTAEKKENYGGTLNWIEGLPSVPTPPAPTVQPTIKPEVSPNVTPDIKPTMKPTPTVKPQPPVEPTVNPELDPETCKHTLFFVAPQDATCTEDGFTGKVICGKGCGYVLQEGRVKPALGHKFKNGSCTRCGHIEGTPDPTPTPPTAGDTPFIDMTENDWFYEPVRWAVQNGITGGTSENTFSPNMTCTRAQIVTFLWAAAGKPEPTSKSPFSDVKEGDWFYKPVIWAVENDITSGTTPTTFSPNIPCSRAQVVALLYKAMQSPAVENLNNPFADVLESNYFHKAVMWALENGIASGMTAELFGSSQPCTRAQIAMFLYKAYN